MVFNNVLFQTSTSVKQTLTVAVLMPFVQTPTDPSIAHVNLDIKEMEKTAQVIFFLVSGGSFSKVPIINGPGKLSPFTLKIEVSIVLHRT